MDAGLWQQTVDVATNQGVIQGVPPAGSYRTDFARNAVDALADDDLDTVGNGWQRVTVQLAPGVSRTLRLYGDRGDRDPRRSRSRHCRGRGKAANAARGRRADD